MGPLVIAEASWPMVLAASVTIILAGPLLFAALVLLDRRSIR